MREKIHSETFTSNQATKSPRTSSDIHDYKHNIKTISKIISTFPSI